MNSRMWRLWLLSSVVGTALVATPDRGERLFSISRTHGPALLDAVGATVILLGWSLLWVGVWKRRARLPRRRAWWIGSGTVLASATAFLVWSVLGDHGTWWLLGAAGVAGVQLVAAVHVSDELPGAGGVRAPRALSDAEARTYRRYVRFAAVAFAAVALYTLVVKIPSGGFGEDWLHTVLHVVTGTAAAYLGWRAPASRLLRVFALAVLLGYGGLAVVGRALGGIALESRFRIPLEPADDVFHVVLAAAAAATVVIAQLRSAGASVVPAEGT